MLEETKGVLPMLVIPPSVSIPSRFMPALLKLTKANRNYLSREVAQAHLDDLAVRPRPCAPPSVRDDVSIQATWRDGWRIYTISPTGGAAGRRAFYLHGGGWVHEISAVHWRFAQQIAAEAGVEVVVPLHPLAHEGGTNATVVARMVELFRQEPDSPILVGDSSGGQIALSMSLALKRDHGLAVPLTVCIAPTIDLAMENPDVAAVQPLDPWLFKDGCTLFRDLWMDGCSVEDEVLNPICGDLRGLGPLILYSGTRDILNPDTRLFVAKAREAGVPIVYHEGQGLVHVWPLTPTPEGKAAREEIVSAVAKAAAKSITS